MSKKWLAVLILFTAMCLCCCFALADGIVLKTKDGTVLNDGASLSGSFYYKIYFSNLPEGCNSIQTGRSADLTASVPDGGWKYEAEELKRDASGRYLLIMAPLEEASSREELLFFRADENSEAVRIALHYNRDAVLPASDAPSLYGLEGLVIGLKTYTLEWSAVEGAEFYQIVWELPSEDIEIYWSEENCLEMSDIPGDPLPYAGDYRARVFAFADGQLLQSSDSRWYTLDPELKLEVPENVNGEISMNDDGSLSLKLHQEIIFKLSSLCGNIDVFWLDSIPDILTDTMSLKDLQLSDNQTIKDFQGIYVNETFTWTPNDLPYGWSGSGEFTRYVVAEANYNDRHYFKSVIIPVHILVQNAITDEIVYSVPTDKNTIIGGKPVIPRNGVFYVDVTNSEDVSFYGMYIARDGIEKSDRDCDRIAESHWFIPSADATTRLWLPVSRCEPGRDYDVHVYAVKYGAPYAEASDRTTVRVTPSEYENYPADCPMIVSMANSYQTGESLHISAHYTNPDSIYGWLNIRVRSGSDERSVIYNGTGEFKDMFEADTYCWTTGTYTVDAYVVTQEGIFAVYPGISTFTVTAKGIVEDVRLSEEKKNVNRGDKLRVPLDASAFAIGEGKPVAAESFYVQLVKLDGDPKTVAEHYILANDGKATAIFESEEMFPGGNFLFRVWALRYGYESSYNQYKFVVTDSAERANISLSLNTIDDTIEDIYASSGYINIAKIHYSEERPDVVRLWTGDRWVYWLDKQEELKHEFIYSGQDITFIVFAQACQKCEYDFDELERNNWMINDDGWIRPFDWDTDIEWTAKSNIISVLVMDGGTMNAPSCSPGNSELSEGGSGILPWGDPLILNILDSVPTAVDLEGNPVSPPPDGWFSAELEVLKADPDNGTASWVHVEQDCDYAIHSGTNHIPTCNLKGGCNYRVVVSANAGDFTTSSSLLEFKLGEQPATQETCRSFTLNGAAQDLQVEAGCDPIQLAACRTGAKWYSIEIKKGGVRCCEDITGCSNGILTGSWRVEEPGVYTLRAFAYSHKIYTADDWAAGNEVWIEELGSFTVTVTADRGAMGEINVTIPKRAVTGDLLPVTINGPDDAAFFSYRICSYKDNKMLASGSRRGTGDLYLNTHTLESGVYKVEFKAWNIGYVPSRTEKYVAVFDQTSELPGIDETRLLAVSNLSPLEGELVEMIALVPGAEGVRLGWRIEDSDKLEIIGQSLCPGVKAQFLAKPAGTLYGIWLSIRENGEWSDPLKICTLEVLEVTEIWPDPIVTVNETTEGLTVPVIEDNPHRIDLQIDWKKGTDRCVIELRDTDKEDPFYQKIIYLDEEDEEEDEDPEEEEEEQEEEEQEEHNLELTITDDHIQACKSYELVVKVYNDGYKNGMFKRTFVLQPDGGDDPVLLLISSGSSDGFWINEEAFIKIEAEGATAVKLYVNNEARYYMDDHPREYIMLRDPETIFYAYATSDPIPGGDNPDWESPSVNWGRAAEPVIVTMRSKGSTIVPTLSFDHHVTQGDWFKFNVDSDGDTDEMIIQIKDMGQNTVESRRLWTDGSYRIPTSGLVAGNQYWVSLRCVKERYEWADGPDMELYVDPPQQSNASFQLDKYILYPEEPFIAMVSAPGAEHIWITDGDWDGSTDINKNAWGSWDGSRSAEETGYEWKYDASGQYELAAWAKYPGDEALSRIDTLSVTVLERIPLSAPQIIAPAEMNSLEAAEFCVEPVEGGYKYTLQAHCPGEDSIDDLYMEKREQEKDTLSNLIVFPVPAGRLGENGVYRITCHVDPADNDYAHCASDSTVSIMVFDTDDRDSRINVGVKPSANVYTTEQGTFIPVNTDFEITVTAEGGEVPDAIAVHMGTHKEYRAFAGPTMTVQLSETSVSTETLFVQAYYGPLSDNPDWDTLGWDNPGNSIVLSFFNNDSPVIHRFTDVVMSGTNLNVPVTLPGGFTEAKVNLQRNTAGGQAWMLDEWIFLDQGVHTVTVPTTGIEPGTYLLTLDCVGPGPVDHRVQASVCIVDDPYLTGPKLVLPSSLKEIGEEAFAGISAKTVIIHEGTVRIGNRAFANSRAVRVVIPASVKEIAADAFAGSDLQVVFGWTPRAKQLAADSSVFYYDMAYYSGH